MMSAAKKVLKTHWPLVLFLALFIYTIVIFGSMIPEDIFGVVFAVFYCLLPLWFLLAGLWYGYTGPKKVKLILIAASGIIYAIAMIREINDIPAVLFGLIPSLMGIGIGTATRKVREALANGRD